MIGRIIRRWALLGLATLAAAGCASKPPVVQPLQTVPLALDGTQKSLTVELGLQHALALTLPPAGVNLTWAIAYHDPRYLKQLTELHPATTPDAGTTVSFLAKARGRTRLRFLLLPPSTNRTVDPVDQQEIIVMIQ